MKFRGLLFIAALSLVIAGCSTSEASTLNDDLNAPENSYKTGWSQEEQVDLFQLAADDISAIETELLGVTDWFLEDGSIATNLTNSTIPGLEFDNNMVSIVWADGETTKISTTFKLPSTYTTGCQVKLFVDESASDTEAQEMDWQVWVNKSGTAFDASAFNQTPVALNNTPGSPEYITLDLRPELATHAATADTSVTLEVWRDNTATGTADLELYYGYAIFNDD